MPVPVVGAESLANLQDSTVRNEVSLFALRGSEWQQDRSKLKIVLTEIPILSCSPKEVHFSHRSTYIHLYFSPFDTTRHQLSYKEGSRELAFIDGKRFYGPAHRLPQRQLTSIFLVTQSHFKVKIPLSAWDDLYDPMSCEAASASNRYTYNTTFHKAYVSNDGKRIYLYMVGDAGDKKYEVTWIVQGSTYYGRVVDEVAAAGR